MMIVWDGYASYTARIERCTRRGKTQWRYVIERTIVHPKDRKHGWWSSSREKVVARAERCLRSYEGSRERYETEGYV